MKEKVPLKNRDLNSQVCGILSVWEEIRHFWNQASEITMKETCVENETYIDQLDKPLGVYLREARLLTNDQIQVALWDQQATGMLFGDILLARGWIDESTIEYYLHQQHSLRLEAFLKNSSPGNVLNTQQFLEIHWGDRLSA